MNTEVSEVIETTETNARRRMGRPPGKAKLRLTAEVIQELVRRVKIRVEAERHSSKAIATDFGVSEPTIVSAIRRLRVKGIL